MKMSVDDNSMDKLGYRLNESGFRKNNTDIHNSAARLQITWVHTCMYTCNF